jgi:choline kinase
MQVVILGAGTGSRLGARTAELPKPAVVVAGRPLLAYDVDFARRAGATRIVVVTGHARGISEPLARSLGAETLYNPRFADAGNLASLEVARRAGMCAAGFLLMNADHVYRPTIAAAVARAVDTADQVTAFVDRDRQLGADDMKVVLDARGRVAEIAKTLPVWQAGYVGMTWVPPARVDGYFAVADRVRRERGEAVHVETVLAELAQGEPAHTADISGHGWLEVDDEPDLARAEAALARDPWYA